MRLCTFEGCINAHLAKGWCSSHYKQIAKYGVTKKIDGLTKHNKNPKQKCSINNCDNFARAKGWCEKHYSRYRRYGDPLTCYRKPIKSDYI